MQFHDFAERTLGTLPIRAKTLSDYRGAYRRHIHPVLGALDVCMITAREVREVIAPLPPPAGYQALMVMKVLFREAEAQGLVAVRPTDHVRSKRLMPSIQPFLRWEDILDHDFGAEDNHVRFLALHGLRWGEAAALRWDDIRDGRVHVTRSIHGAPKSAAGVRSVPYLGHFEPFSDPRYRLAKALQPHGVTIHSLRHTYAYLLKTCGVHITTAQKLMGHSSPVLTMRVYTAVLDSEVDAAGRQLQERLGSALQAEGMTCGHVHSASCGTPWLPRMLASGGNTT